MNPIQHVWFDLDGTLTVHTPEFDRAHNQLRYQAYSEATGRPLTVELFDEYERLYKQQGSNSAVFRSLGLPSDHWQLYYNKLDQSKFFKPVPKIRGTVKKLKDIVPVSLFTNVKPDTAARTLEVIGLKPEWFTHILTGDDVAERKPALDGFHAMIEKSHLDPGQILYVGDRVDADIKPAKQVGIKTCLVWAESPAADYSFRKFEDILTLFPAL